MQIVGAVGVEVRAWKKNYHPSLIATARGDLALRMRNALSLELVDQTDEVIVEDDPVLITSAHEVTRKSVWSGVPEPGWLILTNRRIRFAVLSDKRAWTASLPDLKATHVEDGWVTLVWREGKSVRAVTIGFPPKSKVMPELLARMQSGDGQVAPTTSAIGGALAAASEKLRRVRK